MFDQMSITEAKAVALNYRLSVGLTICSCLPAIIRYDMSRFPQLNLVLTHD